MIIQKKYIIAVVLLSLSAVSYSMDNFFTEQNKYIDPATRTLIYTQYKINKLLKIRKDQDEVIAHSDGHFRKVRQMGCITSIEPVQKESTHQQAKL